MQQVHSTISDKVEESAVWNGGIHSAILLIRIAKISDDGVLEGQPKCGL